MKEFQRFFWMIVGAVLGVTGTLYLTSPPSPVLAYSDRFEDYVLCTGSVEVVPRTPTDGVWMLEPKGGKLLGTVIDRIRGKLVDWAEVDLMSEFGIPQGHKVHFVMTTGTVANGQAALYVAETTTGKFGVYSMGPRLDNRPGVVIRRHDMSWFRREEDKK